MGKWSKEMVTGRKPRGTVKRWLQTVRRSRDQGDYGGNWGQEDWNCESRGRGLHEEMVTITEIKGGN